MQPFSQTKGRALAGYLQLPSAGHKTTAFDVGWKKMCSEGIWEENGDPRVGGEISPGHLGTFFLLTRAVVSQAWGFACLLS